MATMLLILQPDWSLLLCTQCKHRSFLFYNFQQYMKQTLQLSVVIIQLNFLGVKYSLRYYKIKQIMLGCTKTDITLTGLISKSVSCQLHLHCCNTICTLLSWLLHKSKRDLVTNFTFEAFADILTHGHQSKREGSVNHHQYS